MIAGRRAEHHMLVSRLAWSEPTATDSDTPTVELPHLRGRPIVGDAKDPGAAARHRWWPNRAGILETGTPADTVHWHTTLAPEPPDGVQVRHGKSHPADLDARLGWFRALLKTLVQTRGVDAPIPPEAACCIILTPGVESATLALGRDRFPGAIDYLPRRLGEFPGGLQLVMTDEAWRHAEAYAGAVQDVVNGKG